MPDIKLVPRCALERFAVRGRLRADGEAGIVVALRNDLALAAVLVRRGQQENLSRRIRDLWGLALPATPRRAAAGPVAFAWAAPGHWLATAEGADGRAFETRLRVQLSGLASVSDQSGGLTIVRVGGRRVRDALLKGVPIDLHPGAFRSGDSAVTGVAHVGVHMWQIDEAPTYEFAVLRSFAGAFWLWLAESAAKFGMEVQ